MAAKKKFINLALTLFQSNVLKRKKRYKKLRESIKSSRMEINFEEYLCTVYLGTITLGFSSFLLSGIFIYFSEMKIKIPFITYEISQIMSFLQIRIVFSLISGFFVSVTIGLSFFAIAIIYPGSLAGVRGKKLDSSLPYAVNYLSAMSSAGISPSRSFRMLGYSTKYGEISNEVRYIIQEIDILGKDLPAALLSVAQTTASKRFREFLYGAVSGVHGGSDIREYFRNVGTRSIIERSQEQQRIIDTMGLVAESYVSAMVAGTLFLIVLVSVISVISYERIPVFLTAITYIIIPLGTALFLLIIDSLMGSSELGI